MTDPYNLVRLRCPGTLGQQWVGGFLFMQARASRLSSLHDKPGSLTWTSGAVWCISSIHILNFKLIWSSGSHLQLKRYPTWSKRTKKLVNNLSFKCHVKRVKGLWLQSEKIYIEKKPRHTLLPVFTPWLIREREDKQENVKMFLPAFMSCFGKRNYPDFFFFKWNNTL